MLDASLLLRDCAGRLGACKVRFARRRALAQPSQLDPEVGQLCLKGPIAGSQLGSLLLGRAQDARRLVQCRRLPVDAPVHVRAHHLGLREASGGGKQQPLLALLGGPHVDPSAHAAREILLHDPARRHALQVSDALLLLLLELAFELELTLSGAAIEQA